MVQLSKTAPPPAAGHPKGLYLLFTVEMWERMSYYGMRALMVLYMVAATNAANGGFGMDKAEAIKIYGTYTALVYLTPLFGGIIADRWLGQRLCVIIGGFLMMIGQFLLVIPDINFFYAGLGALIIGNGFFKPNISTMVGGLYEQGDARRDGAFTIFYMGINLGAFLSPLVCGTLGEKYDYNWGFASAGVGMALGLVTFIFGMNKLLPDNVGRAVKKTPESAAAPKVALTKEEIDRLAVIIVLAFFVIVFWAAFEQAGGLMNLYTDEKVDRVLLGFEIPTTWFQAVNPALIFILAPLFSMMWTRLGAKKMDPSTPVKMALGLFLLAVGFVFMVGAAQVSGAGGKPSALWILAAYFWHTTGELCLSPIGLSMVTKLSPARMVSMMMGLWFLSNAAANYLAGVIGSMVADFNELQIFMAITGVSIGAGLLLLTVARVLVRWMHGRG